MMNKFIFIVLLAFSAPGILAQEPADSDDAEAPEINTVETETETETAAADVETTTESEEPEQADPRSEGIQPLARASGGSSVVTLSATVKGNQEQPKVLYIVPWQAAQDDQILYQPLNSQTNRIFGHVERSEHKRELDFIAELGGNVGEEN